MNGTKAVEHFYWCPILEAWVSCTYDEYMSLYFGHSHTRIVETN